jgi:hypothetical protein
VQALEAARVEGEETGRQARSAREAEAQLAEQVRALEAAWAEAEARRASEDAQRLRELEEARADAARLRARVEEQEAVGVLTNAVDVPLKDALAASQDACRQLAERLAAAEARAREVGAARAERDALAERVRALQAECERLGGDESLRRRALDAIHARAVAPWLPVGVPERARQPSGFAQAGAPPGPAPALPDRAQSPQGLRQEPAAEGGALQDEVARLKRENTQLRQWLGNFGIQLP